MLLLLVAALVLVGLVDRPEVDAAAKEEDLELRVGARAVVVNGEETVDAAGEEAAGTEVGQAGELSASDLGLGEGDGAQQFLAGVLACLRVRTGSRLDDHEGRLVESSREEVVRIVLGGKKGVDGRDSGGMGWGVQVKG